MDEIRTPTYMQMELIQAETVRALRCDKLAKLRDPFPDNQISKLPKPTKAQTEALAKDMSKGIRCGLCGGWHHKDVVHLDYVGHAALTDRLLDVDPEWSWEPLARDKDGLPKFDESGGLWIKLTICGMTRLGYGDAGTKKGGDAIKEIIGDALRNAAMRFGAALDLWCKGDLHAHMDDDEGSDALLSVVRQDFAMCETEEALRACFTDYWRSDKCKGNTQLLKKLGELKDARKKEMEAQV